MDELTEVRRLWADQAEPSAQHLAPTRRLLLAEAQITARSRRIPPRVTLRLALASGVALAVCGTIITTQVVGGKGTLPAAGAAVLNRAADAAQQEQGTSPRPGQYVAMTVMRSGNDALISTSGPALRPIRAGDEVTYFRTDDTSGVSLDYGVRAFTGRCAGPRPGTLIPCGSSGPLVICPESSPISDSTYAAMRGWPTDPRTLRAFVSSRLIKNDRIKGGHDANGELWNAITTLIRIRPVPLQLRAALFRILASLPGTQVIDNAADAAGRHGIAVAFTYATGDQPVQRERDEIIFDRATYNLLGTAASAAAATGKIPAGSALRSEALIKTTVVDHLPAGVHLAAHCAQ